LARLRSREPALRARYVIHAASMRLGGRTSETALRDSTRNSLKRAAEHGLKSISLPAIGTGIAGLIEQCAVVMLAEIRDHLRGRPRCRRARLTTIEPGLGVFL
jgi:O-acetyl-ADP-ribose deacetylase (regulator of RNase III)